MVLQAIVRASACALGLTPFRQVEGHVELFTSFTPATGDDQVVVLPSIRSSPTAYHSLHIHITAVGSSTLARAQVLLAEQTA